MDSALAELNQLDMAEANKLVEAKQFKQALRIYSEIIKRSKTVGEQQAIIEKINYIKKKINSPNEGKAIKGVKKERKSEDGIQEFRIYPNKFKDVIGMESTKKLLFRQISMPIRKMDMFHKLNLKPMAGIIAYGPPGTGKTLLFKAISGELQIPLAYISLREIRDKYVGGSEKNINKYFELARKHQPCIMFFDEIDALGGARDDTESEGAGTEKKETVTQFLMEISKLHEEDDIKISLVGATNLPWAIDKALIRSGRMEFMLYIPGPTFIDRKRLFKYYLNINMEYAGHIDWNLLALATMEYSGADIEKVCKQVKLDIIEKGSGLITTRAIQKVLKNKDIGKSSLDEFYLNAYHNYVKRPVYKKIGKEKQLIEKGGKFDKADIETYKDFVKDVKRYIFYKNITKVMRFLAKGI